MELTLDRMELDDVGANPTRIAHAILAQLRYERGRVPIHEIAYALDIKEIRCELVSSFEGVLITTPERGSGSILVNSQSGSKRQRFTIGHELGHFLCTHHQPMMGSGFQCTKKDMSIFSTSENTLHWRQEAEANTFAIELLAPHSRMKFYTRSAANLEKVLSFAEEFDISKEAAARRYIHLHGENLAIVFSKNNQLSYTDRTPGFPWIGLTNNERLPLPSSGESQSKLTQMKEVDQDDWSIKAPRLSLTAQTYFQQDGYAMTLLCLEDFDEEHDPGFDDAFDRIQR